MKILTDNPVYGEKVCNALRWLVKHNPLYSSVIIDDSRIKALPKNCLI